jgi:benzodiazapine receptor
MKPPSPLIRGALKRAAVAGGLIAGGLVIAPPSKGGYRGLRQAGFAPPGWLYGPAWTAIELALADSTVRCLDAEGDDRERALGAAVANDALYLLFPLVYFRLRSPVLAAAVTWAQLGAAGAQALFARRLDPPAARGVYPQLLWLCLAAPVGSVQALANPDPLLGTPALLPTLGTRRD